MTSPAPREAPKNRRMALLEDSADKTARSLVSRSDVRVVVGDAPAYHWKTKTLTLPSYRHEPEDPELCDAWRGLIDHECAHVELTDFDLCEEKQEEWKARYDLGTSNRLFGLLNVFEDLWIEPAFAQTRPGCRAHFDAKNRYLVAKTGGAGPTDPAWVPLEAGPTGQPVGQWGAFLQGVLRLGRKSVAESDVHPDTQAMINLCREPIEQGWQATSTAECAEAVEAVWALLEGMVEPPPPGEDGEGEDGEGKGEGGKGEGGAGEGEEGAAAGHGAGFSPPAAEIPLVAAAIGGDWGEVQNEMDVIASAFLGQVRGEYTVHPASREKDKVVRYDAATRKNAAQQQRLLDETAGPVGARLRHYLRSAVQASRMERVVGAQEYGDDLDPNMLPDIALGLATRNVWTQRYVSVEESTYVNVLVDCSGSMGNSTPSSRCKTHGSCSSHETSCRVCGGPVVRTVVTKAGYAAQAAYAIHRALADLRVHHAVLGYTTTQGAPEQHNSRRPDGRPLWSRMSHATEHHVFVEAPGTYDDGSALAYITGRDCNLDGESVLWGARYAARHGGSKDRVIQLVVADGLPAGADDQQLEGTYLQEAVDRAARAGVEVYGIACAIPEKHLPVFRKYYPDRPSVPGRAATGSVWIPSGEGLSDVVIQQLANLLTRGMTSARRAK